MRTIHWTLALAALVACGGGTTTSSGNDENCSQPKIHCAGGCADTADPNPTCIDHQWRCPPVTDYACSVDAAVDVSRHDAGTIACGPLTCNANTEYCDIRGGGVALPDGGSNVAYACFALPMMPCEAGTGCACITNACSCSEHDGATTNECLYP